MPKHRNIWKLQNKVQLLMQPVHCKQEPNVQQTAVECIPGSQSSDQEKKSLKQDKAGLCLYQEDKHYSKESV